MTKLNMILALVSEVDTKIYEIEGLLEKIHDVVTEIKKEGEK